MKKSEFKAKIEEKWITIEYKGKTCRFKRNSKNGVLLESILNNKQGVDEEILAFAIEHKLVVPPGSEEDQNNWLKKQKNKEVFDLAEKSSRAISALTNGKIYLDLNPTSARLVIPEELSDGMDVLMEFLGSGRLNVADGDIDKLNSFFRLCGVDIAFIRTKDGFGLGGNDRNRFPQFLYEMGAIENPTL